MNLHAGLVCVGGSGILVTGEARSGKSSLAVSLLRGAAREGLSAALVADDRVELHRDGERLVGRAPTPLLGLIELSGIGLLRLPVRDEAPVALVVSLQDDRERLPTDITVELAGIHVPRVAVPPRQAPFAADLVLTLVQAGLSSLVKT